MAPYRAPRRRLLSAPNVITFAVFALVAIVVALASAVAHHDDTHIEAPTPVRVPSIHADTPDQTEIEFSTQHGTGKLIMLGRTWQDGGRRPINGSYLEVRVQIICLTGRIGYDPYNFQAFDESGQLFDVDESGVTGEILGVGELSARPDRAGRGRLRHPARRSHVADERRLGAVDHCAEGSRLICPARVGRESAILSGRLRRERPNAAQL